MERYILLVSSFNLKICSSKLEPQIYIDYNVLTVSGTQEREMGSQILKMWGTFFGTKNISFDYILNFAGKTSAKKIIRCFCYSRAKFEDNGMGSFSDKLEIDTFALGCY